MSNCRVVSKEEYKDCTYRIFDLHPVDFRVTTWVENGVIYRVYLFEDMMEWVTKEYKVVVEGKAKTCLEYYDPGLREVCVLYE